MKLAKLIKALIVCIILASAILLSGCDDVAENADGSASKTSRIGTITLRTVEYDGHLWIVVGNAYGGMGLCHHPDCPACLGEN